MYINSLIQLKNADMAGKKSMKTGYSKMDLAVFEALMRKGFIKQVEVKGKSPKKVIEVSLKNGKNINGVKWLSTPSRRLYAGHRNLQGSKHKLIFLSTPEGIMASGDAKKKKLGGELLFAIW